MREPRDRRTAMHEDTAFVGQEMRALRRNLAGIDDARVLRVVAMVDQMAERGSADELIRPLRPRLAALRPARPLRFVRLLFMPMDVLIVPPGNWRRDKLRLPRSALVPVARAVLHGLGAQSEMFEAMLVGHSTADTDRIIAAGQLLWPMAAEFLAGAALPADWEKTGLTPNDYQLITSGLVPMMRHAAALEELCRAHDVGRPLPEGGVEQLLGQYGRCGPRAWSMLVIVLLERLAGHRALTQLSTLAARLPGGSEALREAIDMSIDRLEARHDGVDWLSYAGLPELALEAQRVAARIETLRALPLEPDLARRCETIRMKVGEACGRQVAEFLADWVRTDIPADAAPSLTALEAAELAAESLALLSSAARRLGQQDQQGGATRQASDTLRNPNWNPALPPIFRARLMEILVGTDQALDYLAQAG